ncbi:hypothetical protein V6N13_033374 [Hibiscus sabdariffa]|uniref:Uncharacterized protein n=1 Tax=Hibiscus sabdariffa TaxID=183260 RepID=A0ABR2FAL7_9ROSI
MESSSEGTNKSSPIRCRSEDMMEDDVLNADHASKSGKGQLELNQNEKAIRVGHSQAKTKTKKTVNGNGSFERTGQPNYVRDMCLFPNLMASEVNLVKRKSSWVDDVKNERSWLNSEGESDRDFLPELSPKQCSKTGDEEEDVKELACLEVG